ncbi:MAG: indole-3-glycerol-phosphate synthase TrpC, partial [Actinobacteria bacterium]|nr:indole-3-glycerol-phosphate synthase TrpC [Actinomycetota bacterium]
MSVLDEIIAGVREDLDRNRLSLAQIHEMVKSASPAKDVINAFNSDGLSIIAEVKRSSPSKGALATIADPAALAKVYESA